MRARIRIGPTLLFGWHGDLSQSLDKRDIRLAAGTTVKAQEPPVTDPTECVQGDPPRTYAADGRCAHTQPIRVIVGPAGILAWVRVVLVLIGYPLWLAALWFIGSAFGELMLRFKPIAWPPLGAYSSRCS